MDPVAAALLAAEDALDRGLIEEAALRLEELRETHGDSEPAADLAQRIQLRVAAHRAALRPMPKSLLRHKLAISTLEELCEGQFQTVIKEVDELPAKAH